MIEKMCKVEIIIENSYTSEYLAFLQEFGFFQVEETQPPAEFSQGFCRFHLSREDVRENQHLSEIVNSISDVYRSCRREISHCSQKQISPELVNSRNASNLLHKIRRKMLSLERRKENLESDLKDFQGFIPEKEAVNRILERNGKKIPSAVLKIPSDNQKIMRNLDDFLKQHKAKNSYTDFESISGKNTIAVFVYSDCENSSSLKIDLWENGFTELNFPSRFKDFSLFQTLEEFDRLLKSMPSELSEINTALDQIFSQHGSELEFFYHSCRAQLERIHAYSRLAKTDYTSVLNGWVPVSQLQQLEKESLSRFGNFIAISNLDISDEEIRNIPTLHKNPESFKAFENILKIFPPAAYENLDPTMMTAFTFPLFFGFMLGDVIYGILLLCAGFYLRKKLPSSWQFIFKIVFFCSLSSIFFGFLFWEFLGNLGDNFRIVPFLPLINRHLHIRECLVISVLIGTVHITIGFLLAALKAARKSHFVKAAGEIALIIAIWSILLLVGASSKAGIVSHSAKPVISAVLVCSLCIMGFTTGAFSIFEIFSILGNILSYTRLMAIGFSSVIMAFVANKLSFGAENVFLGFIIGLLLHSINMLLGIFGPAMHALRLHYVEFFPKFYESTGREFTPLRYHFLEKFKSCSISAAVTSEIKYTKEFS